MCIRDSLKPYKDLLELVQTVKAGSTAAAGLKGLDGMVESVRQLDRFLPPTTVTSPVLRSRNGVSVSTLLGDAKTRYETAARECETALKTYQDAMRNLKSTNVLLGSESQVNDAQMCIRDRLPGGRVRRLCPNRLQRGKQSRHLGGGRRLHRHHPRHELQDGADRGGCCLLYTSRCV